MERYGDSMKVDVVRRYHYGETWREHESGCCKKVTTMERHGDSMKVGVVGRLPLWRGMKIA